MRRARVPPLHQPRSRTHAATAAATATPERNCAGLASRARNSHSNRTATANAKVASEGKKIIRIFPACAMPQGEEKRRLCQMSMIPLSLDRLQT